ncbi:hypothetical protein J31TS4_19150 [Paenibacillus sp. J31TS4]|uniref:hypothetical protein n=1 Tax=Paenibacillus sp. J31TS4 TaxID=2807195 RepID=UPI001B28CF1E|nr:hypothetical protein [Paenibacillus sp. J31TS4]GIP38635.1 hypothetical protein J31TS4_19150 [Paenibacillus sp. J31TS4]
MPYYNKEILTDGKNKPIPQQWSESGNEFRPFTGESDVQTGFSSGTQTVGTTAVELKAGSTALPARRKMLIRVVGNDAIYLGPSAAVTKTTGYPLLPGEPFSISLDPMYPVKWFAIAESNQTVKILECN